MKYLKLFEDWKIYESDNIMNLENLVLEYIKGIIKGTEFEGKVYLAGGAVRDEFIGKEIKDIDLLVNMEDGGIRFSEWITKKLGIYREGSNPLIFLKFGTAKFNLLGINYKGEDLSSIDIECVMPRKETYKEGNRKPDVMSGTLEDDVNRRDFTINSLLKNLSNDEILDLTGMGVDDIKRGIVRTPLNPDVIFSEDPLRMLRAIRFAVKYNWDLPFFMIKSIKRNAHKLNTISKERITSELNKMLITDNPDVAIRLLQITDLSKHIFPELDNLINLKQNKYHKWDTMKHSLYVLKNTPPDLITRLSALFHDIGKYETQEIIDNEIHFYKHEDVGADIAKDIMTRLKYPNDIIDAVYVAVKNHMRTKQAGKNADLISDKSLRRLKMDLGKHLETTLDVIHADNISHKEEYNLPEQIPNIRKRLYDLKDISTDRGIKLPINGFDIMNRLDVKPGRIVKYMLKKIEDAVLENPDLTKEEAFDIIDAEHKMYIDV